jgi:transposase-like protein
MKSSNGSPHRRRKSTDAKQRAELLAAFDRSGLTAAAFARQQGLHYTTFCNWRQRRAKSPAGFVEVELSTPAAPVELTVELGAHARMRLTAVDQVDLAVRLIRALNASGACSASTPS